MCTTIKPFLTCKSNFSSDVIAIEKNGGLISNYKEPVELFDENSVDIVEISSWKKPTSVGNSDNPSSEVNVKRIVNSYNSHQVYQEIDKIIWSLNTNKANVPDRVVAKIVNVIGSNLRIIINNDICCLEASIRLVLEKNERAKKMID